MHGYTFAGYTSQDFLWDSISDATWGWWKLSVNASLGALVACTRLNAEDAWVWVRLP